MKKREIKNYKYLTEKKRYLYASSHIPLLLCHLLSAIFSYPIISPLLSSLLFSRLFDAPFLLPRISIYAQYAQTSSCKKKVQNSINVRGHHNYLILSQYTWVGGSFKHMHTHINLYQKKSQSKPNKANPIQSKLIQTEPRGMRLGGVPANRRRRKKRRKRKKGPPSTPMLRRYHLASLGTPHRHTTDAGKYRAYDPPPRPQPSPGYTAPPPHPPPPHEAAPRR